MSALYKILLVFFFSGFTMATLGQTSITEKQFANKLYSKKISTDANYQKLLADIENKQLNDRLDFLNYCDNAVIIYLNNYPEKPEDYLEKIHKDVARILPDLAFTDFNFQIVMDSSISDDDSRFFNFVISIKSNGKTYRQKSNYHLYSVLMKEYFGNKIDQQEFFGYSTKYFRIHSRPTGCTK